MPEQAGKKTAKTVKKECDFPVNLSCEKSGHMFVSKFSCNHILPFMEKAEQFYLMEDFYITEQSSFWHSWAEGNLQRCGTSFLG